MFLNLIPVRRAGTVSLKLRYDLFWIAIRWRVGLPPVGVAPSDECVKLKKRFDNTFETTVRSRPKVQCVLFPRAA